MYAYTDLDELEKMLRRSELDVVFLASKMQEFKDKKDAHSHYFVQHRKELANKEALECEIRKRKYTKQ